MIGASQKRNTATTAMGPVSVSSTAEIEISSGRGSGQSVAMPGQGIDRIDAALKNLGTQQCLMSRVHQRARSMDTTTRSTTWGDLISGSTPGHARVASSTTVGASLRGVSSGTYACSGGPGGSAGSGVPTGQQVPGGDGDVTRNPFPDLEFALDVQYNLIGQAETEAAAAAAAAAYQNASTAAATASIAATAGREEERARHSSEPSANNNNNNPFVALLRTGGAQETDSAVVLPEMLATVPFVFVEEAAPRPVVAVRTASPPPLPPRPAVAAEQEATTAATPTETAVAAMPAAAAPVVVTTTTTTTVVTPPLATEQPAVESSIEARSPLQLLPLSPMVVPVAVATTAAAPPSPPPPTPRAGTLTTTTTTTTAPAAAPAPATPLTPAPPTPPPQPLPVMETLDLVPYADDEDDQIDTASTTDTAEYAYYSSSSPTPSPVTPPMTTATTMTPTRTPSPPRRQQPPPSTPGLTREQAEAIMDAADMAAAEEVAAAADAAASAAAIAELAASEAEAIALQYDQQSGNQVPAGLAPELMVVGGAELTGVTYDGAISAAAGDPAEAARIMAEARAAAASASAAVPVRRPAEPSAALLRARWYSAHGDLIAPVEGPTRGAGGGVGAATATPGAPGAGAAGTGVAGTAGSSGTLTSVALELMTEEEGARAALEAVAAAQAAEAQEEAWAEAAAQAAAREAAARATAGGGRGGGGRGGGGSTAAGDSVYFIPMPRPALDVAVPVPVPERLRQQQRQISAAATRPNLRGLGVRLNGSATVGGMAVPGGINGRGGGAVRVSPVPRAARTGNGAGVARLGEPSTAVTHGPVSAVTAAALAASMEPVASGVTVPLLGGGVCNVTGAGGDASWPWCPDASAREGRAASGPVVRVEDDGEGGVKMVTLCCDECHLPFVVPPGHAGLAETAEGEEVEGQRTKGKTTMNCRNCWKVVCDACVGAFWARSMVPPDYAADSDSHRMRVCKPCHVAMEAFRKALLLGNEDDAMEAFSTGLVNLQAPYTPYHGELPVHCAAAGGNVRLLAWLVDQAGCSLFVDRERKVPVRDLRQLTVLGAAAVNGQIQAMRYLVNKQGCDVSEIAHLPTLKRALQACLVGSANTKDDARSRYVENETGSNISLGGRSVSSTEAFLGICDSGTGTAPVSATVAEEDDCCIVCFDRDVDCTIVPCGHHCCCLVCAHRVELCPVCRKQVTERIKTIPV